MRLNATFKGGSLENLLDAGIGNAGHAADLGLQGRGELSVLHHVRPADRDVDGRRRAEIQDLADNVGRLEGKGRVGEFLRQQFPQGLYVVSDRKLGRVVERKENVGIEDANSPRIAVGEIYAAERQADVVDAAQNLVRRDDVAYLRLDLVCEARQFNADVKPDCITRDVREEVLSKKRHQGQGEQRQQEERHLEHGKPIKTAILDGAEQIVVAATLAALHLYCFVPMFGLGGVSGYLFRPLAEAVVVAMTASYLWSRTLVPTMANYLLSDRVQGSEGSHGCGAKKIGRGETSSAQLRAYV
jgi:hypothetical protein